MNRFKENHPLTYNNLNNLKLDLIDYIFYIENFESKLSADPSFQEEIILAKNSIIAAIHMIVDLQSKKFEDEDYIDLVDFVTSTYGVLHANHFAPEKCSGDFYKAWILAFETIVQDTYDEIEFEVL